jgi:hypothetical protein
MKLNSTTGPMPSIDAFVTEVDKSADSETVHPILNYTIRKDATRADTEIKDLGETKSRSQQLKLTTHMLSSWEAEECRRSSIIHRTITHRLCIVTEKLPHAAAS